MGSARGGTASERFDISCPCLADVAAGFGFACFASISRAGPARQAGGTTPRISLAWNINRKVLPGSMLDAVKQQRPAQAD